MKNNFYLGKGGETTQFSTDWYKNTFNFNYYDVKIYENFNYQNFSHYSFLFRQFCPILRTPLTIKKISCVPLTLSRQEASFNYPNSYIWRDDVFEQKSGKIGRNSKMLLSSFKTLKFISRFIFQFFDKMNIC